MENITKDQTVKTEVITNRALPEGVTRESMLLLEALQARAIRFAHWKSNSHLVKGLAGKTDLDLLVYPQDRQAFEAVMESRDYKKLQSQPWSTYPQVEDWLGMDQETGSMLHIHTHYALVTGIKHVKHLYLPWIEAFFQQLTTDEQTGWPIPRPELEAIILLIRIWAKTPPAARLNSKPSTPVYLQQELEALLRQADPVQLAALCKRLSLQVPPDLHDRIRKIVAGHDAAAAIALSQYFYSQLKPYYRKAWPLALATSCYYQLRLKAIQYSARYVGPHRLGKHLVGGGKIFALVGCDGSGKSTLSKDLLSWLTYKIDTHYFYLGKNPHIKSYNKKIIAREDVLFGPSFLGKALKKLLGDHYFVVLVRKKEAMLQLAAKMRRQGSVILCDRFPQQDVAGMNDGPHLRSSPDQKVAALEQQAFHRIESLGADVIFRLQVSPEMASQRKPEHDFASIKRKSDSISKISFPGSVVIPIDADQPYEQVLLTIKKEIWKNL